MLKKLEALKNEINDAAEQNHDEDGSELAVRDSKNGSKMSQHRATHHDLHDEQMNKTQTKNKFKQDPDQSQVFNAIDRENPLLMKRYFKNDCNISAIYNPDYRKTRKQYNANYAYVDPNTY